MHQPHIQSENNAAYSASPPAHDLSAHFPKGNKDPVEIILNTISERLPDIAHAHALAKELANRFELLRPQCLSSQLTQRFAIYMPCVGRHQIPFAYVIFGNAADGQLTGMVLGRNNNKAELPEWFGHFRKSLESTITNSASSLTLARGLKLLRNAEFEELGSLIGSYERTAVLKPSMNSINKESASTEAQREKRLRLPDRTQIRSLIEWCGEIDQINLRAAFEKARPFLTGSAYEQLLEHRRFLPREYDFVTRTPDLNIRRLRARWCTSFPAFSEVLRLPEWQNRIDAQVPLAKQLAAHFDIPPAMLRRIRTIEPAQARRFKCAHALELARLFGKCSINQVPNFAELSIADHTDVVQAVGRYREHLSHWDTDHDAILANLIMRAPGNWCKASNQPPASAQTHTHDFINAFARCSIAPLVTLCLPGLSALDYVQRDQILKEAKLFFVQACSKFWSLENFLRASEQWHDQIHRNTPANAWDLTRLITWTPICDAQLAPNGLKIIPITSNADLKIEGAIMHHCVGSYATRCASGTSHVFSIQTRDGTRLSTLELECEGDSKRISIRQHLAACNRSTSADANAAANWLVEGLNKRSFQVNEARVRESECSSVINFLGFNPHNSDEWHAAIRPYMRFAPRELRHEDPLEFCEACLEEADQQMPETAERVAELRAALSAARLSMLKPAM